MSHVHRLLMAGLASTLGFASRTLTGQTLEERAARHARRVYPNDIAALEAAKAKRERKNAKRLKNG